VDSAESAAPAQAATEQRPSSQPQRSRSAIIEIEDLVDLVPDEDEPEQASVQLRPRSEPAKREHDDQDKKPLVPRFPPGVKVY
jgi:hypothetical protein